ncbi:MAG: hypothetical protein RIQ60_4223 [Pseudomonadota bacterium]|jgi:2'-5' RNA ligase
MSTEPNAAQPSASQAPPKGATLRLFLALWPGPEVRSAALRWQAAQHWPATARLHDAANLHLTLPFIGAVAHAQVPALAAACALPLAPFDLVLDHVEAWPRGVVVLAPSQVPEALLDLHRRLRAAVLAQGLALDDRDYRPHLTLARHAEGLTPVDTGLAPLHWRVSRYVLALSAGGHYSVVQSYPAGER